MLAEQAEASVKEIDGVMRGLTSHSGSGGGAGAARSGALEMDVPTPIKPWYRAIVSLVQMLVGAICIQVGMKEEDFA